jgi:LysR family hydrogen peroxide-inducible transcriptional activator
VVKSIFPMTSIEATYDFMSNNTLAGLSLRDLEYAVTVRRLHHFGRAAAHCNVSQPTLSAQIQKLEALLGLTLFERTHRRVEVTARGEAVLARAERLLAEARDLLDLGREIGAPLTGDLSLGAIETLGPYYLPQMLYRVRAEYRKLRLLLSEQKTAVLIDRLQAGELDAALLALPAPPDTVATTPLFFEPFHLVCPNGHRLENLLQIHLQDLEGDDLLLLEEGHCLRDQALALCQPAHDRRTRHATSVETLWHMIAAGEGYSLLPLLCLEGRDDLAGLVVRRPLVDRKVGRTIGLAWRATDPRASELQHLAEFLRRTAPAGVQAV